MSSFIIPRNVFFGEGVLSQLKTLKATRAAVVIGGDSIKKNGGLDSILGYLKEASIETLLIEGVENDPSVTTVLAGAEKMRAFQPDVIVAVGGGSPIDAAKAMWLFYEQPNMTFEQAAVPFSLPELRKKAFFVAIPTTSGTATEVTSFAVITDDKTGIKYPLADYNLTPDFALVDTDLAQTLSPLLVAHTGMDALTHAFEAYVSVVAEDVTDALAIKAIEMTRTHLVNSFNGDRQARAKMHIAQCLAGMAFSNAILGIVHSMAHKSGKILNIPHGCANAIYLPHVIAFNAATAPEKYVDIAKRLGLSGTSDKALIASLVAFVEDMNRTLNIPATLKEYGTDETVFLNKLESMAATAVTDPCTGTNPRVTSIEEMKNLFMLAYYGKQA